MRTLPCDRRFAEWREGFPNAACVVSLVDRLLHHAEIVFIEGNSYRLKEGRDRSEQRSRQRRRGKSWLNRSNDPPICVRFGAQAGRARGRARGRAARARYSLRYLACGLLRSSSPCAN